MLRLPKENKNSYDDHDEQANNDVEAGLRN